MPTQMLAPAAALSESAGRSYPRRDRRDTTPAATQCFVTGERAVALAQKSTLQAAQDATGSGLAGASLVPVQA